MGGDYKIASLDVLNFFDTLDVAGAQTDKLIATLRGMDADVIGLNEIENDFAGDTFALQTLVDGLNAN